MAFTEKPEYVQHPLARCSPADVMAEAGKKLSWRLEWKIIKNKKETTK